MANLSNINNVLRTNSTGVGIFDDAASYPLEITSATTAGMRLLNTGASGATYDVYGNATGEFLITKVGVGERLSISSGGAITFNNAYTFPTAVTTTNNYVLKAQTDGSTAWAADSGMEDWIIAGDTGTTTITDGDTMTIAGGTNVTTAESGGTVTINSTDQYVGTVTSITLAADSGTGTAITTSGTFTFTGGTNVTTSVSGTTVTINSTDQYTGTVTSVAALTLGTTGTDLSSTVTGGTGAAVITLQVPSASAANRGALTAADWTTFNNKTGNLGTVTSVAGSAGTGISISGSPITSSGTLTITNTGVTSIVAGTNISISGATGAVTVNSTDQYTGTVSGTGTATRVAFWSASDTLSSNANLYWDNGNNRLGIGTTAPSNLLHLKKTTDAFQALIIETTATYPAVSNAAGSKFTNSSGDFYMFIDNGGGDYSPGGGGIPYARHFRLTGAYPLQLSTNDTIRMTIAAGGDVGINDTTPSYKLDVDGTIRATGDVIAYSDIRVKENIKTIDNSLEKVSKLRGVSYTRKDIDDKSTKIGVIAQEVIDVLPEVVSQDDKGKYSVAYGNISGLLIEAIKELKQEIEELKSKPCNCNNCNCNNCDCKE